MNPFLKAQAEACTTQEKQIDAEAARLQRLFAANDDKYHIRYFRAEEQAAANE
jgi:hypothetical protein